MNNTVYWLIGIVLTMSGIGLTMFNQGKLFLAESDADKKRVAKGIYNTGKVWIGVAFVYLFVVIYLLAFRG